ncbi:preprotein translocase subunit SecG [Ghiorsea bivora]|uniref:preprotein translocase subunit SecG n=1 Tax=Ghiorsea bivora TaxID=1485545 RepID=UPI00056F213E|nr:preprotein translocase subunit SecG [Ghiorsea bivora]
MTTVLLTIHIIVAILLIVVVLMQRGQEGGMGGMGGGSSQTLFGASGSGGFLVKATGVLATIFMTTSLSLAFFSQQEAGSGVNKSLSTNVLQEQSVPAAGQSAGNAVFDSKQLEKKSAENLPSAE